MSAWSRYLRPQLADLSVYDVPPAGPESARMHANECPEPWPAEVMEELGRVIREVELGRYPDTSGRRLRAVLAARHGVAPERVVLGNGSDEIIFLLLTALSGPEARSIVIPRPTFVMYGHTARVLGLDVTEVPLTDDLQLDEAGMDAALSARGVALCFLARPNNPTSSLFDADAIHRLAAAHPATVFVIDEAYAEYAPGSSLFTASGPANLVFMATLSKVGLAALRLGYCVAHEELALALNKVRHPYNVSQTTLLLAETVLSRFGDVQRDMVARATANRDRLAKILARIPGAHVYPAHANLVLCRVGADADATRIQRELAARGVLVKNVSGIWNLTGCIRASVGTSDELDRLEAALAEVVDLGA